MREAAFRYCGGSVNLSQVVLADAVGLADVERGIPFSFDTYCRMYCVLWQHVQGRFHYNFYGSDAGMLVMLGATQRQQSRSLPSQYSGLFSGCDDVLSADIIHP